MRYITEMREMILDIVLSLGILVSSVVMAYVGVRVSLDPPTEAKPKRRNRALFWLLGGVAIICTIFQGVRNARTQRALFAALNRTPVVNVTVPPSKIVTQNNYPPPAPPPVSAPTVTYKGVGYIETDNEGRVAVPVNFTASGSDTLVLYGMYFSFASSPAPSTPADERAAEDEFWGKFKARFGQEKPTTTLPMPPGVVSTATVELGPEISKAFAILRERGGKIFVAIRLTNARGKALRETCLAIDPATSYASLCHDHNRP